MSNRQFIFEQLLDVSHHPVILGAEGIQIADSMAETIINTFQNQHQLVFIGVSQFQRVAELLAGEFQFGLILKRPELPVLHLQSYAQGNQNRSAVGEDMLNTVEKSAGPGDTLIVLTQESSEGIERILSWARRKNLKTLLFCGYPKPKKVSPDHLFYIPLINPSRLEEAFIIFAHIICTVVESVLFTDGNTM